MLVRRPVTNKLFLACIHLNCEEKKKVIYKFFCKGIDFNDMLIANIHTIEIHNRNDDTKNTLVW